VASREGGTTRASRFVTCVVTAALGAACGGSSGGPAANDSAPRPLEIALVEELGAIRAPAGVTARDVGASALLGGRVTWMFGDTLLRTRSVDGESLRTCTSAVADAARPLETTEPTDAAGAPSACMAFTADEAAFNRASGRPDLRIALWPGSVVPLGDGSGLVFYLKLTVNPGVLNYQNAGVGVARIAAGTTTAVRDAALLFPAPEPAFDDAAVLDGAVYAYGLIAGTQNVAVATAPLAQAATRSAYRFWSGSSWSTDVRAASALFGGVSGAVTVSYNAYLRRYLAVSSEVLSGRVLMRVADRPEGPWEAPVAAFSGQAAAGTISYAGREHPELAQDGGRRVFVSYYRPGGGFAGELRLVAVTFR
jgi:hypothetical protein